MEKRYMISDAAKMIAVENHVLRYWEEELGLCIPRNEKGHRFYRETDMQILRFIRDLKEQGFQLKAIKMALSDMPRVRQMDSRQLYHLREELNQRVLQEEEKDHQKKNVIPIHQTTRGMENTVSQQEKLKQFETMLKDMIRTTMEEMSQETEQRISETVTTRLQKEMDYLLRQREEIQSKQVELLEQILSQVKREGTSSVVGDAAVSHETENKSGGKLGIFQSRKVSEKKAGHKKLFAKSV